jgi:hypothetical protein
VRTLRTPLNFYEIKRDAHPAHPLKFLLNKERCAPCAPPCFLVKLFGGLL